MSIDLAVEVDPFGYPTEAARAREQVARHHPTARAREEKRLPGAARTYAIWETARGKARRLSLDMPSEATAWINANSQLDSDD